jgi:hypothetical protein
MILLLLALAAAVQGQGQGRATLGIYDGWGAFRDAAPMRCFAIARPVEKYRQAQPFVSIASWPRNRVRDQLHIRLSRARAANARVTLSVGERRFELMAGDSDAWAPDARTDAAIVAAMRDGRSMSVESVGANGVPFADSYALKGAASAIDAAALACAGR